MEYYYSDGEFPRLSDSAVTLGKFDGMHRGHKKLTDLVLEKKKEGLQSVVFAFTSSEKMIITRKERAAMLEKEGIDVLIECPLTDGIRHMKPDTFVREILVGDLNAGCVVIGEDFRFGYERRGTPETLRLLGDHCGFETCEIPKEMDGRRKISSTYIREELKDGHMEKVSALLGFPFYLEEEIVHGAGLGHRRLLPTINQIPPEEKLLPPNGVYVSRAELEGRSYYGMTNIGYKPTVDGSFLGVETYLFGCSEDLYGQTCRLSLLHYQRPEKRFGSLDQLKAQLQKDAAEAEKWLEIWIK